MENNRKLALYVAYYLARFDKEAIQNLGYKNWDSAFLDISEKLKVRKHSVKNWRDEFDPLFCYRAGWHGRPMAPSRTNVALALENLEEPEIRAIVEEILTGKILDYPENLNHLLSIPDNSIRDDISISFVLRGPTGKKAEQFFIEYHRLNSVPIAGELIDTRDLGSGYDFEIRSNTEQHFIEVKGIASTHGGILFTNKEWEIAKQKRENYSVCVVSKINESPEIMFINDPVSKLNPRKDLIQTVQIQWSVSSKELKKH
jgi:hypothetical protein